MFVKNNVLLLNALSHLPTHTLQLILFFLLGKGIAKVTGGKVQSESEEIPESDDLDVGKNQGKLMMFSLQICQLNTAESIQHSKLAAGELKSIITNPQNSVKKIVL